MNPSSSAATTAYSCRPSRLMPSAWMSLGASLVLTTVMVIDRRSCHVPIWAKPSLTRNSTMISPTSSLLGRKDTCIRVRSSGSTRKVRLGRSSPSIPSVRLVEKVITSGMPISRSSSRAHTVKLSQASSSTVLSLMPCNLGGLLMFRTWNTMST